MKKFLIKLGLFSLILFSILSAPVFLFSELLEDKKIFSIPPETEYLILGNSRPECALNDEFIDDAYNFSNSGEAYFYTYVKARELAENNNLKNIKAVFIQFTLADVSHVRDEWVWGQSHLQYNYPKYIHTFTINDYKILSKENLDGLVSVHFFQTGVRQLYNLLRFNFNEIREYYGGYFPNYKIYSKSPQHTEPLIQEKLNFHKIRLIELVQLFQSKNIPVYLISCPVHLSKWQIEKNYRSNEYLKRNGIKAEYLDFSNFPLPEDHFADRSHLNYYGAKKFSQFFNQLLKDGLLKERNKQYLINLKENQIKVNKVAKGT